MPFKKAGTPNQPTIPLLLVATPGAQTDRKVALLETSGFSVTRADTICHAEIFAAEQYFDAALYDDSIPAHEQIALARVMRVRWPWMRLVSAGKLPANHDPDLFDASSISEENLPTAIYQVLIR